jgi:photosystem II stability/assembly factor-like uncharacterized protein
VYKTTNDGGNFASLGNAMHCDSVAVDFADPARMTMIAGGHERHSIWHSTDSGQTWTDLGPNLPTSDGYTGFVMLLDSQTYLAASWSAMMGGVFRTTDSGTTWTQVSTAGNIDSRPHKAMDGKIYWILDSTQGASGLIVSGDQGVTWTKVAGSEGIVSTEVGLVELPDGRFVTVGMNNLIISADHGATWEPLGPTLPWVPWGVAYSTFRKQLYIWHWTCDNDANSVQPDALDSLSFDYAAK